MLRPLARTLRFLAAAALQPKQFLRHAQQALSVCLQRGNAQVALLGQAELHLRRQQAQRPRGSSWTRWQHTGCAAQLVSRRCTTQHSSTHTLEPQLSEAAVQGTAAVAGTTAALISAGASAHFASLSALPPLADITALHHSSSSSSHAVQQQWGAASVGRCSVRAEAVSA